MTIKGTKKQARKRHRQSLERRMLNEMLPETFSVIDVGWRKGVLHRNTASRYKSRMARQAQAVMSGEEA